MNAPDSKRSIPFPGWPSLLGRLIAGEQLGTGEAAAAMREILGGVATPAQIAGFLVALRSRGESASDLREMLAAVRDAGVPVEIEVSAVAGRSLLDIVGTGGDNSHSVNLSTMAAIVVAAAGVPVCKHGNRAASSVCGAADVLESLGVAIEIDARAVARCIVETGIGFCFAPSFHPGFRHAGPVRRELGVPTVFNLLGPMANPAPVTAMVVGVSRPESMEQMAEALSSRGVRRAWVVHGHDGMDELVLSGPSEVVEVVDGGTRRFTLEPSDHGFARWPSDELRGGTPEQNAGVIRDVLAGRLGAVRDTVVLNAAAGLVVSGGADTLAEGRDIATAAIDGGAAASTLESLVAVSNSSKAQGAP